MKKLLKDIFFLLNIEPLGKRASILSYHNIGDDGAYFTVKPGVFSQQIKYLASGDYKLVKLSVLIDKLKKKEDISNSVSLTFNDGYKSFYTEVFPLLKEHQIPATCFVTVEFLDTTICTSEGLQFKTLAVSEMREMQESGLVEFMPQTEQTVRLSQVVFDAAISGINNACNDIKVLLGTSTCIFAYPKGDYTSELANHLRDEGNLIGAVTLREGLVHIDSDPYALNRNSIDSKTSFVQFKGKLGGAIESYIKTRKR